MHVRKGRGGGASLERIYNDSTIIISFTDGLFCIVALCRLLALPHNAVHQTDYYNIK